MNEKEIHELIDKVPTFEGSKGSPDKPGGLSI